jgi:integrase
MQAIVSAAMVGIVFASGWGLCHVRFLGLFPPILPNSSAIAAGLSNQISAHWLRHQRCSDLVNSGKFTLSQVQQFMRHSSPTITSTYIHIDNEIGSNALL